VLCSESPQDITGAARDVRSGKECVRKRNGGAIGEGGASRCQQIALGLDAAELCRFDEAVEERGDFEAAPRARAVVILATEDHTAEAALGSIVVERNARVVEKARQPRPQPEQITDGLPQAALWQRPLGQRPRLNLADDRARALIAASDGTVERRPASSSFRRVAWVKNRRVV